MRNVIKNKGFSLLELSVVLVIIGTVLGATIILFNVYMERSQYAETQARMAAIQEALFKYRIVYDRLPCPSDPTAVPTTAGYGMESISSGTCTGTGGYWHETPSTDAIVTGGVPALTLGLPDEMMYDGWGKRFTYSVFVAADLFVNYGSLMIPYTSTNAFTTNTILMDAALSYEITIFTSNGQSITDKAIYALWSAGPNGHGAYTRGGVRYFDSSITNVNEWNNCDCDASAAVTPGNGEFVLAPEVDGATAANNFDDLVVFAKRSDLRSYRE